MDFSEADRARFWSKVNKNGPTMPHMETPCWMWTASTKKDGYGRAGNNLLAHRASFSMEVGAIGVDLCVLHKCDNPPCCNPCHLFLGTRLDNARDCISKGRFADTPKHGIKTRFSNGNLPASAKLTLEIVGIIRARRSAGETLISLSREFGVSNSRISEACNYKSWRVEPAPTSGVSDTQHRPSSRAHGLTYKAHTMKLSEAYPSNFLKADDLNGREVTVTIASVDLEEIGQGADKERKLVIGFVGKDKKLVCNRTNAQTIETVTGCNDTDDWLGQRIILTARDVDFQGRTMLAIRVSLRKPVSATAAKPASPAAAPETPADEEDGNSIPF